VFTLATLLVVTANRALLRNSGPLNAVVKLAIQVDMTRPPPHPASLEPAPARDAQPIIPRTASLGPAKHVSRESAACRALEPAAPGAARSPLENPLGAAGEFSFFSPSFSSPFNPPAHPASNSGFAPLDFPPIAPPLVCQRRQFA